MQMAGTSVRLSIALLVVASCWLSRALHNHIVLSPLLSLGEQSPLGREAESLSFSSTWQLLGPFRTGTRGQLYVPITADSLFFSSYYII